MRATLSSQPDSTHIGRMAKRPESRHPAKHSKKDPAKPTRAKAARPDTPALDPSLAELSESGHRPGPRRRRLADRHAGAAGHRTPRSLRRRRTIPATGAATSPMRIRRANRRRTGSASGRNPGYVGQRRRQASIAELADALGYGGSDPSRPLIGNRRRQPARRPRRDGGDFRAAAREAPPPLAAAGDARRHRLDAGARKLAARGPRRIPRGRSVQNLDAAPAAAAGKIRRRPARSSSNPNSIPRATSRRRSRNWSKACGATTARRCCSASPARARPSPWPR